MLRLCALALCLGVVTACGPVQSTAYLYDAAVQIEAAKTAGADKAAPYEWTLANLYLHKAREEVGYSDFEAGVEFARKASLNANKARQIAMGTQTTDTNNNNETPAP